MSIWHALGVNIIQKIIGAGGNLNAIADIYLIDDDL